MEIREIVQKLSQKDDIEQGGMVTILIGKLMDLTEENLVTWMGKKREFQTNQMYETNIEGLEISIMVFNKPLYASDDKICATLIIKKASKWETTRLGEDNTVLELHHLVVEKRERFLLQQQETQKNISTDLANLLMSCYQKIQNYTRSCHRR